MYFLAKSLRIYSKSFRGSPEKFKLYKNGELNLECLAKNISYFIAHPEQIKQKLKQKDAYLLCQFFDSEEYKKRVSEFLETQGRILSKETVSGAKSPGSIKYQHVLSCAQPSQKEMKIFFDEDPEPEVKLSDYLKKKKMRKCTIFEGMIRRKTGDSNEELDNINKKSKKVNTKIMRTRSTIMPIFLKKLNEKKLEDLSEYDQESGISKDFTSQTARRIKKLSDGNSEPMYSKILHKCNAYKRKTKITNQNIKNIEPVDSINVSTVTSRKAESSSTHNNYTFDKSLSSIKLSSSKAQANLIDPIAQDSIIKHDLTSSKVNSISKEQSGYKLSGKALNSEVPLKVGGPSSVVSLRMASSTAKLISRAPVTTKLYPKKNMNRKSFSDFLYVEPTKMRKSKTGAKNDAQSSSGEMKVKIKILKTEKDIPKGEKKGSSLQMLMEQVKDSKSLKSLKLDDRLEKRNTLLQILKNRIEAKKEKPNKNQFEIMSLYRRVKLGNLRNIKLEALTTNEIKSAKIEKIILKPKIVEKPKEKQKSFTYKIVAKDRERHEKRLKTKFNINPPYWNAKFNFAFEKPIEEINMKSLRSNLENVQQKNNLNHIMQNNLANNLHRPVPHFVEHSNKPRVVKLNQYHVRLPKTTPEGYRVLLYGVRDPDPTKMNFNDVIKGFCMYNDCILSEDGLQEGYVVIFDMKDVCIGHLARVSLPALKCFMSYIQEAHPCRLKQIHVLNTASWIHHIMRLIVPLVRSELLNLIKFHKGNIPEGLPQDILPMDYSGEAPTLNELDRDTKSVLNKYRDWLIETGQFKSDESKRIKKSGWWGFFSSKSQQEVELDEKTILRNLQID